MYMENTGQTEFNDTIPWLSKSTAFCYHRSGLTTTAYKFKACIYVVDAWIRTCMCVCSYNLISAQFFQASLLKRGARDNFIGRG